MGVSPEGAVFTLPCKASWDRPRMSAFSPECRQWVTEPDFCTPGWPAAPPLLLHGPSSAQEPGPSPEQTQPSGEQPPRSPSVLRPTRHRCPGRGTSSEPPHLLLSEGRAASPRAGALQEREKGQTDPRARAFEHLLYVGPWLASHAELRVPGERQACRRHAHRDGRTKWGRHHVGR